MHDTTTASASPARTPRTTRREVAAADLVDPAVLAPAVQDIGILPRRIPQSIDMPAQDVVAGLQSAFSSLRAISSATGAHFYDASDPSKVTAILGDLVTSF